jgi:hypothetical protein
MDVTRKVKRKPMKNIRKTLVVSLLLLLVAAALIFTACKKTPIVPVPQGEEKPEGNVVETPSSDVNV